MAMMRLWWRFALRLTGGFILVNAVIVTLAQSHPLTHLILTTFTEQCDHLPSPCWAGISPGHTSLAQVRIQLLNAGYQSGSINESLRVEYFYLTRSNDAVLQPGCVKVGFSDNGLMTTYIRLHCMDDLRLGTVFALLGMPQGVLYRPSATVGDTEFLALGESDQLSGIVLIVGAGWDAMNSPISSIDLYPLDSPLMTRLPLRPWHGFISVRQYCRLEPLYPRC